MTDTIRVSQGQARYLLVNFGRRATFKSANGATVPLKDLLLAIPAEGIDLPAELVAKARKYLSDQLPAVADPAPVTTKADADPITRADMAALVAAVQAGPTHPIPVSIVSAPDRVTEIRDANNQLVRRAVSVSVPDDVA